ncbi:potassium-transporting ATPase subunit F [Kaistia sp. 32K]|uniref:SRPBCC family protein n=1 Tax=Kaistia sp. 32K TaxID=2795690 RepID=UPI001915B543|nr:SRPBCC family protein [Kaistia sp. 32K]BCP54625.1 potassium-transporting ATPase subunit F [Kaistia sp. 32K]
MLKFIAIALALLIVVIGVVVAYAATRPDRLHIQREARIHAPPERIFPLLNDFHSWALWSPYEKLDPAMQRTFAGPASGEGSVYEWSGSGKVGAGRMEIAKTSPPSQLRIDLDFIKPMRSSSIAEFTLVPDGDATRVRWSMDGPAPLVTRVMGLFVDMDKLIGSDFESGLANLKAATEGG